MDLCVVACVAKKRPQPAPAADLYCSPWFRKARAWVEHHGYPWRILSARHGLVHPDTLLDPYEQSLHDLDPPARRAWSDGIISDLHQLGKIDRLIVLAGRVYRQPLHEWGSARLVIPMSGLGIGQQLSWLARR